jgi:rhodanese-related sulfurtransferase
MSCIVYINNRSNTYLYIVFSPSPITTLYEYALSLLVVSSFKMRTERKRFLMCVPRGVLYEHTRTRTCICCHLSQSILLVSRARMKDQIRLGKLGFALTKPWFRFRSGIGLLLVAASSILGHHQASAVVELSASDFYERIVNGMYDVIADVRTASEFNEGHIRNSTLVESLADAGSASEISVPADLAGCEKCSIIVYCRSGRRADVAIQILAAAGFEDLYDGAGINQWTEAGYDLETSTSSTVPPCTVETAVADQCVARSNGASNTTAPVEAPFSTSPPTGVVVSSPLSPPPAAAPSTVSTWSPTGFVTNAPSSPPPVPGPAAASPTVSTSSPTGLVTSSPSSPPPAPCPAATPTVTSSPSSSPHATGPAPATPSMASSPSSPPPTPDLAVATLTTASSPLSPSPAPVPDAAPSNASSESLTSSGSMQAPSHAGATLLTLAMTELMLRLASG